MDAAAITAVLSVAANSSTTASSPDHRVIQEGLPRLLRQHVRDTATGPDRVGEAGLPDDGRPSAGQVRGEGEPLLLLRVFKGGEASTVLTLAASELHVVEDDPVVAANSLASVLRRGNRFGWWMAQSPPASGRS